MSTTSKIASKSTTKSPGLCAKLLERIWPKQLSWNVISYLLLPPALLFLTIGVSAVHRTPATGVLPFLGLVGFLLTVLFRNTGIAIAYSLLAFSVYVAYKHTEPEQTLLVSGLFFALALSFYIALLCVEEVEAALEDQEKETKNQTKQIHAQNIAFKEKQEAFDQTRSELEDEIEKWKEEAESRRIEKRKDEEKLAVLQQELSHFNGIKDQFIQEAVEAKKEAYLRKNRLDEALALLEEKEQEVRNERLLREQKPQSASIPSQSEDMQHSKRLLSQSEGKYNQLREQFEQKCAILNQTRAELYQTQTQLLVLEKEMEFSRTDSHIKEFSALQSHFSTLVQEREELENELSNLEQLVSRILNP